MSLAKFLDGRRASFTGSKPVDMGRMRAPTGRGGPSSASGRRASQKSGTSTSYGASHSANKGSLQSSGKVQGLVQSIQQQNQLNQQNQMMQQNQSSQNQNSLSPSNLLSPAGLSNVLNRSNRSDRSQSKSKQNSPDRGQNQQNQNQNDKKNNNNNESSTKASPSVSPRNNNNANLNTSNKMNTDSQDKNNNNNNVPGTSISVKAQTLVKAVNNNNTNWKPGPQSHMGLDSSSGLEDTEDEKRKGSSSNQKKPGGPTLGLGTGYNNAQSSTQGPKITLANPSVDSSTTAGDRTSNTNSNLNNTINTSTTQSGMNFSYSHGSIENISDVWSYMTGGPESLWKGNLKDSPGFHGLKINNKCFVGKHNSGKPVAIGKGTFGIVFLGEFHQEWLDARQDSLGQNMLRHIRGPLVLKRQVEVGRSSKVANETQALALLTLAMCSPAGGINGQYDGDPIPPPNRLVPLAFGYFRSLNSEGIRKHHLLTEYAPGGDFHRVLKNTTFTERQLTIVTHQILHAVHFCHYNGIIHRDIKTHNFLISRFGNIQLGDFGLSYCCVLQNNGQNELTPFQRLKKAKLFKFVGTVVFCAPEQRATLKNFDVYDAKFVTADPLLLSDPMLASEDGENNKGQIDPLLHQQQVLDNNPNLSYYDYRADIFACGVVLFNAWSRGIPGMSPLEKSAFEKAMHQAQKNHESKRRQLRFELVKLLDERQSNVQTIRKCALKDFPAEGGRGNPDGSRSPVQQPGINQDSSLSDLMFDLLENNPDSRPQQLDIALKHPCFNQYCKKEFTSTNQFNHITHLSDKDLWDFKVLNNIDLFHIHHFTNAEKDLFANRHDSNLITSRYATVHPQYDLSILKKGLSMKYGPGNSSGGSKSRNNNKYIGTSNDYDNNNNSNINQSGGPGPNRSNANGNNNIRQIQSTDSINSQTGLVDDFTSQENIDDIENRARSIPGIPTRGERDLLDQAVIGNSIHNSIQGMNQKGGKNFSPPSRQGNSNQNNYNNNQRGDNSYQNNNNSQQGFGQQNQNKNNNNNNYRNNNNNNYSNNQQMSNVIDDFNAQGPSGLIQYDEHGNIVAANIPTFEPLIEGENNACCCVNESASSRGWSSLFPWLWRR